ncbi:MAG: hypothetical protein ACRC0F_09290 [Cetobacterium sp.]
MLEKVMNNMKLTDSQKRYINRNKASDIAQKIKSIWTVVENASEYAFQC